MSFNQNIRIWEDTRLRASHYYALPSLRVTLVDSRKTIGGSYKTYMDVIDEDSLALGYSLTMRGHKPLILIFADDRFAGGDVANGSGAQEESLWRRTNLCLTQSQAFYPLSGATGIYIPAATIFKDIYGNLMTPWLSSFIAVPGLHNPQLTENGDLTDTDRELLRGRIRLICQTGVRYGHDSLVLGPLGCGAWRTPPHLVSQLFKEVLLEYNGAFRVVFFACLRVPDSHYIVRQRGAADNYLTFKGTLMG